MTVEDPYGAVVAEGEISQDGTLELTVLNPVLWNTENPYLYTVILTTKEEVIVDHIGFRTIEYLWQPIYFNSKSATFLLPPDPDIPKSCHKLLQYLHRFCQNSLYTRDRRYFVVPGKNQGICGFCDPYPHQRCASYF